MQSLRRQALRSRRLGKLDVTRLTPRTALLSFGGPRLRVMGLGKGAWLVRQRTGPRRRLKLQALDEKTWVLRRGGRRARVVEQIGPPRLRTDLVIDQRATRRRMRVHQLSMLHYLAEEHIAWMLRELEINCVLDVGANRGQYARRLRRAGFTGRIVSFEPLADVAEKLEKVAANDPDWHVLRYALGQTTEEAEMSVAGGQGRMSSLLPASEFGRAWSSKLAEDGSASVSIRRLDELFAEAMGGITNPRVYLKLDTQGYDLQAFAGAGECIEEIVGMQSEVSAVPMYESMPGLTEQIATYEAAGFELTGMFPVMVDGKTLRVIEFDAVMIRVDALRK